MSISSYNGMGRGHPIRRFFDTVGDGSGSAAANVNASVTPSTFRCDLPVDETWLVSSIAIQLSAGGAIAQAVYGSGVALTNGYDIYAVINGSTRKLTMQTIKANDHFIHNDCEYSIIGFTGGVDSSYAVLKFNHLLKMRGKDGDYLYTTLNDDFSGLNDHTFAVTASIPRG